MTEHAYIHEQTHREKKREIALKFKIIRDIATMENSMKIP